MDLWWTICAFCFHKWIQEVNIQTFFETGPGSTPDFIDGITLFNSSQKQLWPFLGCVITLSSEVFVVGLYNCGMQKPEDIHANLRDLITELIKTMHIGLYHTSRGSISLTLYCLGCMNVNEFNS